MPVARLSRLAVVLGLLAGCVVQDPSGTVMCFEDSDCDPGEVCGDDHICYGNPPATLFHAALAPPVERPDLAPTEVPFSVTEHGDFVTAFAETIEVSGRIVLTESPGTTVPAHIVFRRPSRIKGAPDHVVAVDSRGGVDDPAMPSFRARLLPTLPGESYSVTIYPDDSRNPEDPDAETLAQRAPPYRQLGFSFDKDTPGVVFPLGGENGNGARKIIRGRVLDSARLPVAGLDVRAYGRFGPLDLPEVASSRGVTAAADGSFEIAVPSNWEDEFEVRITPPPGTAQPSIVLSDVLVDDVGLVADVGAVQLPTFPAATTYFLSVLGEAREGGTEEAVGARVSLRTVLFEDPGRLVIAYEAQGAADENGLAEMKLIPAATGDNRLYTVDVAPVPNTPHRSIWGESLAVGPAGGVLALGTTLGRRVLVSGTLLDATGTPLEGVSVSVAPSVRLSYELAELPGTFNVQGVQFPTSTTAHGGGFEIWVDPEIRGVEAGYTLAFDPPAGSLQPRWTEAAETRVAPDVTGAQPLGDIWLPDPAYVRGTLTSATTEPVGGAEIRLYEVLDDITACAGVAGTEKCTPPAVLRAQGTANEKGAVRLVLPRK